MSTARPGVSIFYWHSISEGPGPTRIPPAVFRDQLAALAESGCVVLALDDVAAWLAGARDVPARAAILTFDDGFRDFATVAFPALAARSWPSTLFLCAGRIGGRSDWPGMPAAGIAPLLDWSAVADLAASGVAIGAHGLTHLDLTRRPLPEAEVEIADSGRLLEERVGRRVSAFAYPFGRSTPALRSAVARRYVLAVGTAMRRAEPGADPYLLPRIDMTYFRDPERLRRFLKRGTSAYFAIRRVVRRAGQAVRG
jgi:peptidoglycan/xylan/chitin deacetylase (PgdA/CDA1 family)